MYILCDCLIESVNGSNSPNVIYRHDAKRFRVAIIACEVVL